MSDGDLRYTFTCPSCNGNFSIQLDRIPPVRARFRCPHCKQPMDFPSRDEARIYSSLQAAPPAETQPPPAAGQSSRPMLAAEAAADPSAEPSRFQVVKAGFEEDVFDRRAIRALIRTGEVVEGDRLRVDDGEPVHAEDLPYLKSLFNLRKTSKVSPPRICRTHTDKVAFFVCQSSGRPLCEDCSIVKKYGNATVQVCNHCGGTATEFQRT